MSSTAEKNPSTEVQLWKGRRWIVWPAAAIVAVASIGIFWGAGKVSSATSNAPVEDGKFYTVTSIDLDVKVRKDGELQAVNNTDVLCQVEGRSTIVYLVKEGEAVKKGDLLVELDSSTLRQSLEAAGLEVKQADADLKTAREMLAIQVNQNQADLEAAQVALDLAKLALEQYEKGTYPQDLADAQTLVRMTEITVRNKEEDLEQTRALFARGFVTAGDVKQAELSVTTVHNDLRKAQTALTVLTTFKHQTEMATNRSAVSQAEQKLARVKRMNASLLSKVQADVETKQQAVATKTKNLHKLEQQLEYCKIYAPADGMVVYGRDDDEFRMIEGAQVRERQRLIRLPDTSQMKAVVKINESQVPRLRAGQRALVRVVGTPDPIAATITKISPMADGGSRWWNPDLREYPVELVLDQAPPDARPGLSAQVEIFIEQIRDTLAVPLASIYSQGKDSYVFARRGEDVLPVKVDIGGASETHARVSTGVKRGEDVLILEAGQGRQLLERAGIDTGASLASSEGERGPGPAPKSLKLDNGRGRSSRNEGHADAKASAEKGATEKAAETSAEKSEKEKQPTVVAVAPKQEPKSAPAGAAAPAAPVPAGNSTEPHVAPAVGKTAAPVRPAPVPVTAVDVSQ